MSYTISSEEKLKAVCQDLSNFDKNTQKIVVKKTEEGVYYPATAPKSRGIKWFFELFTGFIETPKVNKCMENFILENQKFFPSFHIDATPAIIKMIDYERTQPHVKKVLTTLNNVALECLNAQKEEIAEITRLAFERAQELLQRAQDRGSQAEVAAAQALSLAEKEAAALITKAKAETDALQASHLALMNGINPSPLGKRLRTSPGDFKIECSDGTVNAHKIILQAYPNSMFRSLVGSDFEKADSLNLKEYSTATVDLCMDLLYGAVAIKEIPIDNLLELYVLVDFLCLKELKEASANSLLDYVKENQESAFDILKWLLDAKVADLLSFENQIILMEYIDYNRFWELTEHQRAELLVLVKKKNALEPDDFYEFIQELCEGRWTLDPLLIQLLNGLSSFLGLPKGDIVKRKLILEQAINEKIDVKNLPKSLLRVIAASYTNVKIYDKASQYAKLSCEENNPYSFTLLGSLHTNLYVYGQKTVENTQKALTYFSKAAALGSREALSNLGRIYSEGYFGEKDIGKAVEYFRGALTSEDQKYRIRALYFAGQFFYKSTDPALKEEGKRYLLEAAKEKDADAIKFLKGNKIPFEEKA